MDMRERGHVVDRGFQLTALIHVANAGLCENAYSWATHLILYLESRQGAQGSLVYQERLCKTNVET